MRINKSFTDFEVLVIIANTSVGAFFMGLGTMMCLFPFLVELMWPTL